MFGTAVYVTALMRYHEPDCLLTPLRVQLLQSMSLPCFARLGC
nr:MAG TPA: hypothetical protein [Caudoviricetes sp.]